MAGVAQPFHVFLRQQQLRSHFAFSQDLRPWNITPVSLAALLGCREVVTSFELVSFLMGQQFTL